MDFGLTWFWDWELSTQLWTLFGLVVYFLPTILAYILRFSERGGVFLFNFLIGWTVVGWFLVLNWVIGAST
jgi:hypothetical protein